MELKEVVRFNQLDEELFKKVFHNIDSKLHRNIILTDLPNGFKRI
jgi:hypothetical protein